MDELTYDLIYRFQQYNDQEAFEELFEKNYNLIRHICRKYTEVNKTIADDIIMEAELGFFKAIKGIELERGMKLSTYLVPTVEGNVKRFLRDKNNIVRLPRDIFSIKCKVNKFENEFCKLNGYFPSVKLISEKLDIAQEEIVKMKAITNTSSIDSTLYRNDDENSNINVTESLGKYDEKIENFEFRDTLDYVLNNVLEEKEKKIIIGRFIRDITQTQLSKELAISQVQVSRIEHRAMKKLKEEFINSTHKKKENIKNKEVNTNTILNCLENYNIALNKISLFVEENDRDLYDALFVEGKRNKEVIKQFNMPNKESLTRKRRRLRNKLNKNLQKNEIDFLESLTTDKVNTFNKLNSMYTNEEFNNKLFTDLTQEDRVLFTERFINSNSILGIADKLDTEYESAYNKIQKLKSKLGI